MSHTIKLYELSRGSSGLVTWQGPTGTYTINTSRGDNEVADENGLPVLRYERGNLGEDGILYISLDGEPGLAATLLHFEDDRPRKYYFATDNGGSNPLGRPAFILRAEGIRTSPVPRFAGFKIMVVR